MIEKNGEAPHARTTALAQWSVLLQDEIALVAAPGTRHKELLTQAYALHRDGIIDSDDLSDLLEQADGALAYAVEALIDRQSGE
jgi:predicted metal-dependent hydrolase